MTLSRLSIKPDCKMRMKLGYARGAGVGAPSIQSGIAGCGMSWA
jgi:hypothetical protein